MAEKNDKNKTPSQQEGLGKEAELSSLEQNRINQSKKALQLAITNGEKIDRSRYTSSSYSKLYNAIKEGKIVLKSDEFSKPEIDKATDKINSSIKNLKLNNKEINKSAGVVTAAEIENERRRQEIERERELSQANNSESQQNLGDLSEADREKELERLRVEKREREIQETLSRKDELDRQKMRAGSEVGEGRGLGRDSGNERFKERVVDERTDPENWDKNKLGEDDVDEEVLKEQKKVKDEKFIERHEAFSREERVPNQNFTPHIEEDETLTPAAQMAKEMQEAAEREDMGLDSDSVSDAKGIEKKEKKESEYDKKIKNKYSPEQGQEFNIEQQSTSSDPYNGEYKRPLKQREDENNPLISSREERIPDRSFIDNKKDETLTPAAQAAKEMQEAAEREEMGLSSDSISKASGIEQKQKEESEIDRKIKEKYSSDQLQKQAGGQQEPTKDPYNGEHKRPLKERENVDDSPISSREDRIPDRNFVDNKKDETLTPAAQMAKEMQEAAKKEDVGLGSDSVSNAIGIEQKLKEESEIDKKIRDKYGSDQVQGRTEGQRESVADPYNGEYKKPLKQKQGDENSPIPSSDNKNNIPGEGQPTKAPAGPNIKPPIGETGAADTIKEANDVTLGGASGLTGGNSKNEREDEERKKSQTKKTTKASFEYINSNNETREKFEEIMSDGKDKSTSSVTDASGITPGKKKEDDGFKLSSDKFKDNSAGENRVVKEDGYNKPLKTKGSSITNDDFINPQGRQPDLNSGKPKGSSNITGASGISQSSGRDDSIKTSADKLLENSKAKEEEISLSRKEKLQAEQKNKLLVNSDRTASNTSGRPKGNTLKIDGVEVKESNSIEQGTNKRAADRINSKEAYDVASGPPNQKPIDKEQKPKTSSVSEASGISDKKEDSSRIENSAERMLRENKEKLGKEKEDPFEGVNEREKVKEAADKDLLRKKSERFNDKNNNVRNVDGVNVKEVDNKDLIDKKTPSSMSQERVSADELVKNGPAYQVPTGTKAAGQSITGAVGFSKKADTFNGNVKNSAEEMLKKNYELTKISKKEEAEKYRRSQKDIKTVEEKQRERLTQEQAKKFKGKNGRGLEKTANTSDYVDKKGKYFGYSDNDQLNASKGLEQKKKDARFDELTGKLKNNRKRPNEDFDNPLIRNRDIINKDAGISYSRGSGNMVVGNEILQPGKGKNKAKVIGNNKNIDAKNIRSLGDEALVFEQGSRTRFSRKEAEKNRPGRLEDYEENLKKGKEKQSKYFGSHRADLEDISNEGYDSLSSSKGIKSNVITPGKQKNAIKNKNKGSIKMRRGNILEGENKIYHKEAGEMRLGKNAGVEDANTIAAGIRRKEDELNKHMRNRKEKRLREIERAKEESLRNKSATEQYNELSQANSGTIRFSRGGKQDARKLGKDIDNSPMAKINTRHDKLNATTRDRMSKRNSKISTQRTIGRGPRSSIVKASEQAKLANQNRLRFLQKQGMSGLGGFNIMGSPSGGGLAKAKVMIQNFGKKALSASVLSGLAVGSTAGTGMFKGNSESEHTNNRWYPTEANIPEDGLLAKTIAEGDTSKKTLTQAAVELVQARLNAYYKQVMNQELTEDEKEKAGINIKPLKKLKIKKFTLEGKKMDPNSITFETVDDFKINYTYVGSFSTHTEPIGVGTKESKFDFVDRNAKTIGKKWFILDEDSDIEFPDGSKGDGAGKEVKESSNKSSSNPGSSNPTGSGNSTENNNTSTENHDSTPGSPTNTSKPAGHTNANGETQMDVMLNMIGAFETGGQVYGQRDYGEVKPPLQGGEKTMTIGWSSFYDIHAKQYLERFRRENPDLFNKLDNSGQVASSLTIGDWGRSRFNAGNPWKKSVRQMLLTEQGKALQDKMTAERLGDHWHYCAKNFTKEIKSVMMYTQIAELGGSGRANQVFRACRGNYSLDNIMRVLKTQFRTKRFTVGGWGYDSRHAKYVQWLKQKFPQDEDVDLTNIETTGAGAMGMGMSVIDPAESKGTMLFIKEMLAMSMTGGFYKDPANKKEYFTYIIDLIDYAVSMDGDEKNGGKRGVDLEMTIIPSGETVSWQVGLLTDSAPGKMLKAEFRVPVLSDLKILEENDKNFKDSWNIKDKGKHKELFEKYGDMTPQSYIALHSYNFNKLFNVKISPSTFGGLGYGFDGVTGIPYVDWALMIANDDTHGYDQNHRAGGIDFDCSSLVWFSLKQAGFPLSGGPFTTGGMDVVLRQQGFQKFPFNRSQLQPGDIMLRDGHTEIYIGNGQSVGAHGSETNGKYGKYGDQTGHEISVVPCGNYTWAYRPPKAYVDEINEKAKEKTNKEEKPSDDKAPKGPSKP